MAIPRKDSQLVQYGANWNSRITATPTDFGLTAGQATAFDTLYDAFVAAYNAQQTAKEAGTRSTSLTTAKNVAKDDLLRFARELYSFVQASLTVTDANKELLGVVVRKTEPTPQPAPDSAPDIDIVSVSGNVVRIRLHDSTTESRRGRPPGTKGAAVFTFVGPAAPISEGDWVFQGNTIEKEIDVAFPSSTAPGSKVWFTAFWFNNRTLSGPPATNVSTNLPGGTVAPALSLREAA